MKRLLTVCLAFLLILSSCPNGNNKNALPVISLSGQVTVYLQVQSPWSELGYKAVDGYGKDISSKVVINTNALNTNVPGSYTITYDVIDDYGNKANTVSRYILVGNEFAPEISILGANPCIVTVGSEYVDFGATAKSSEGVDLTQVMLCDTSSVDTSTLGAYDVVYTVTDESGATTVATRAVVVVHTDLPMATFDGAGNSEEAPVALAVNNKLPEYSSGDCSAYMEYLMSNLPSLNVFDLQDGDISYKASIRSSEGDGDCGDINDLFICLKSDQTTDAEKTYKIIFTITDSDDNVVEIPCFIKLVTDATPPVAKFKTEADAAVDTLEVDVWKTNLEAYEKRLSEIKAAIEIADNADTNGEFKSIEEATKTDNSGPGMSVTFDDSALRQVLTYTNDTEAPSRFDRVVAVKNIHAVYWTITDKAGNSTTLTKRFQLVDTTPPQIIVDNGSKYNITYAASKEIFPKFRDNSGLVGYSTPVNDGGFEAVDSRVVGEYQVALSAVDNAFNTTSATVTYNVLAPTNPPQLNNPSFENVYDGKATGWDFSGALRWKSTFSKGATTVQMGSYDHGKQVAYAINGIASAGSYGFIVEGCLNAGSATWFSRTWGTLTGSSNGTYYKGVKYKLTYKTKICKSLNGTTSGAPKNYLVLTCGEEGAETSYTLTSCKERDKNNFEEKSVEWTPSVDAPITVKFVNEFAKQDSSDGDAVSCVVDDFKITIVDYPKKN